MDTLHRRAMIAGVAIAAGLSTSNSSAAAQADADTMRIVAEIDRMHGLLNSRPRVLSEEAWEALLDQAWELEGLVLRAPCTSPRVAAAQLRLGVPHMLNRGDRNDGADRNMMRNVIAFLEAN